MIQNPVPWPDGARCAVALTFDMDADSILHLEHPEDSISRVSAISMLRYGPEVAVPRIVETYVRQVYERCTGLAVGLGHQPHRLPPRGG